MMIQVFILIVFMPSISIEQPFLLYISRKLFWFCKSERDLTIRLDALLFCLISAIMNSVENSCICHKFFCIVKTFWKASLSCWCVNRHNAVVKKDVNQKTHQSILYLVLCSELRFRTFTEIWSWPRRTTCGYTAKASGFLDR